MTGSGADMGGEVSGQAVLLDAMGTLLRFEDPAPRLRAGARARLGVDVGAAAAAAAIRAEIAFYRAHLHDRPRRRLARRAARALRGGDATGARPRRWRARRRGADGRAARRARLLAPTPTRRRRCARCAPPGCALVVVSNWDGSLHERLEETGLAPLVDGAVASAELGARQARRRHLRRALALAGVARERAWHVGDTSREDVEGALAAGIRPVLVARDGGARRRAGRRARDPQPGRSCPRLRRARRPLRCAARCRASRPPPPTLPRRCPSRPELPEGVWRPGAAAAAGAAATRCRAGRCGRRSPSMLVALRRRRRRLRRDRARRRARRDTRPTTPPGR